MESSPTNEPHSSHNEEIAKLHDKVIDVFMA